MGPRLRASRWLLAKRGGFSRYLAALGPTGVALFLQFATFAITARGLGIARFGQYTAITALAAILLEIVGIGGPDLLVRSVARNPANFPSYFGNMLLTAAATLPPVVVLGSVIALLGVGTELPLPVVAVGLCGEILAGRSSASIEAAMIAHGHTFGASLVRVVTATTRFVAAAIYFVFATSLAGWVWVVLAQSCLLAGGLIGITIRRYGRPVWRWQRGETRAGLAFTLNQSARALQGNVDRLVLSRLAEPAVVGAYAAGARLLLVGLFPIQVLTRMLYPDFFRHGERGIAATRRYALSKAPAMIATSVFAFVAIAAVAQFLPAVLGRDFATSRHPAVLLAMAMPLIGLQYLAADTLTGAGYQHVRAIITTIASIGFGAVMALGAKMAGVNGVILGFFVSHLLLLATLCLAAVWISFGARSAPRDPGFER